MTHQSIYINHQGELLLIDAPEKPKLLEDFSERLPMLTMQYEAAIASAIAKGVKFKDQEQAKRIVSESNKGTLAHYAVASGQTFPLPTGYKVSFQRQCKMPSGWTDCHLTVCEYESRTVAILSKLEEESKEENDKTKTHYVDDLTKVDWTKVKQGDTIYRKANLEGSIVAPSEETVSKDEITEKEKSQYWYLLGAAEGVLASIGGKKPDFEKAWKNSLNK